MDESPKDWLISDFDNSGAQDEKNNTLNSTTSSSSAMRQLSQENVLSNLTQIATMSVYPNDSLGLKSLEELFRNEVFRIPQTFIFIYWYKQCPLALWFQPISGQEISKSPSLDFT